VRPPTAGNKVIGTDKRDQPDNGEEHEAHLLASSKPRFVSWINNLLTPSLLVNCGKAGSLSQGEVREASGMLKKTTVGVEKKLPRVAIKDGDFRVCERGEDFLI
jgi:hypothetical protein